jgi:hypothetical protein
MTSKTEVTVVYRHVSVKILKEFPQVPDGRGELGKQRHQLRLSLEGRVENPEATIESFNRQFNLG